LSGKLLRHPYRPTSLASQDHDVHHSLHCNIYSGTANAEVNGGYEPAPAIPSLIHRYLRCPFPSLMSNPSYRERIKESLLDQFRKCRPAYPVCDLHDLVHPDVRHQAQHSQIINNEDHDAQISHLLTSSSTFDPHLDAESHPRRENTLHCVFSRAPDHETE
jgi:hypothetical protein